MSHTHSLRILSLLLCIGVLLAPRGAHAQTPPLRQSIDAPTRPSPMVPLYGSYVLLQVLDVASTLRALDRGGREANPLVVPFASSPAGLIAFKAGTSALAIYASERLWRQNRVAAVITIAAINGAYTAVVAHNFAAAKR